MKEWLGDHSKDYQQFMTEGQLHIQAEEFLQDGVFSLDIGDLVITALSNMLQAPVVIFTSRANLPIHIQNPTYSPMISSTPVYLSYLHTGPGHYDAVVHTDESQGTEDFTPTSLPSCSCGRKKTKGSACSFSLDKYSCRCPCYNERRPCTQQCKCRDCTNSFGTKAEAEAAAPKPKRKRKRASHENQTFLLRGRRSMQFMEAIGEMAVTGSFSKMEFLVICSIIQSKVINDNWKDSQALDPEEVWSMYNCICELAQTLHLNLALYSRSSEDIAKLIHKIAFQWDVFYQKTLIINDTQ